MLKDFYYLNEKKNEELNYGFKTPRQSLQDILTALGLIVLAIVICKY